MLKQQRKLKFLPLIFALLSMNIPASAQRQKVDDLLNEVSQTLTQSSDITIEFAYTMENKKAGINQQYNGVLISKGERYNLDVAGQNIICDGQAIYTILKEMNEVQINAVDNSDEAFSPTNLLGNWADKFRAHYTKSDLNATTQVELSPKKDKSIKKVILNLNNSSNTPRMFRLMDKNGNIFTYDIKRFSQNDKLPDNLFTFNKEKYPDAEIIDMR